ncbi:hypothetical protein LTR96_000285 [Exophiala xenobiotica]|nr:hypothetical protein LTR96_000285 [Exophiala xenobiotica]KAK5338096.1 hypothetical protein LTR98_005945 [Exophiala xenobiotica]
MLRTAFTRSALSASPRLRLLASISGSRAFSCTRFAAAAAPSKTLTINGRDISVPTGLFINGEFVTAQGGNTMGVEDPSTGQELIRIQEGREEDVDIAVKVARKTFEAGDWSHGDPVWRGKLLNRLADILEANTEEITTLECADTGKTFRQASALDVPGSVGTLRYYGGWADKVLGLTSFNIPGTFAYTRREPVGVCGQIIPWNFPLLMFIWKIAPALATGNTVVIKSAEATPLSALKACEYIKQAGFPAGTVNLISGYGKTAGNAIANHMDVDKLAFTGSTATGRAILKASAESNLKKVTLELGGKSPNIVFPDADLEKAVEWSAWGINMNFGQTCHAGTRIYVHDDIYDKFLSAYTNRMESINVGAPFDESTDQGPQNSKMQYDKILGYIESGKQEGATVHLGGSAVEKPEGGYYIEPTIFTNCRPEMKIMREEIFGPVVAITRFSDEADVIKHANDTHYGLAAAVHTKDYERAIRVTNALKAGTTWVNMYNFVHYSIPFGGYKESGLGRECGEAALENYTETKAVYFNMGLPAPRG